MSSSSKIHRHEFGFYSKYSGIRVPEGTSINRFSRFSKTVGLESKRVLHFCTHIFKGRWEFPNRKYLTKCVFKELQSDYCDVIAVHLYYRAIWVGREHLAKYKVNRDYDLLYKLKSDPNKQYVAFDQVAEVSEYVPCIHLVYWKTQRQCEVLLHDSKGCHSFIKDIGVQTINQQHYFTYQSWLFRDILHLFTYVNTIYSKEKENEQLVFFDLQNGAGNSIKVLEKASPRLPYMSDSQTSIQLINNHPIRIKGSKNTDKKKHSQHDIDKPIYNIYQSPYQHYIDIIETNSDQDKILDALPFNSFCLQYELDEKRLYFIRKDNSKLIKRLISIRMLENSYGFSISLSKNEIQDTSDKLAGSQSIVRIQCEDLGDLINQVCEKVPELQVVYNVKDKKTNGAALPRPVPKMTETFIE